MLDNVRNISIIIHYFWVLKFLIFVDFEIFLSQSFECVVHDLEFVQKHRVDIVCNDICIYLSIQIKKMENMLASNNINSMLLYKF
jgi:hypothetical protein